MAILTHDELTNRERQQMEFEQQMFDRQSEHTQKVKAMELEVAKIEAKWSNIYRLPLTLVKLPLYVVLGISVCIAVACKRDVPEQLYDLLRR